RIWLRIPSWKATSSASPWVWRSKPALLAGSQPIWLSVYFPPSVQVPTVVVIPAFHDHVHRSVQLCLIHRLEGRVVQPVLHGICDILQFRCCQILRMGGKEGIGEFRMSEILCQRRDQRLLGSEQWGHPAPVVSHDGDHARSVGAQAAGNRLAQANQALEGSLLLAVSTVTVAFEMAQIGGFSMAGEAVLSSGGIVGHGASCGVSAQFSGDRRAQI